MCLEILTLPYNVNLVNVFIKSEIPGYNQPDTPKLTLGNIFLIIGVLLVCLLFVVTIIRNINESALFKKVMVMNHFQLIQPS